MWQQARTRPRGGTQAPLQAWASTSPKGHLEWAVRSQGRLQLLHLLEAA